MNALSRGILGGGFAVEEEHDLAKTRSLIVDLELNSGSKQPAVHLS